MKYLTVVQGEVTVLSKVDDKVFKWANGFRWRIDKDGYVYRSSHGKKIALHRLVNNTPPGKITDHKNRDKLDNRSRNLRTVDNRQNQCNQGLLNTNSTGYKGVWLGKSKIRPYKAGYQFEGKSYYVGSFTTARQAAKAYDKAVSKVDSHCSTNRSLGLL